MSTVVDAPTVQVGAPAVPTQGQPALPAQGVLAFSVGAEAFAVDVLQVREIRHAEAPLRLMGAPAGMLGVLHLRGLVVPVLCLRRLWQALGQGPSGRTGPGQEPLPQEGVLIVVDDGCGGRVAVRVDAVAEVLDVQASQVRPTPPLVGTATPAGPSPLLGLIHRQAPDVARAAEPPVVAGDELLQWLDLRQLLQCGLRPDRPQEATRARSWRAEAAREPTH